MVASGDVNCCGFVMTVFSGIVVGVIVEEDLGVNVRYVFFSVSFSIALLPLLSLLLLVLEVSRLVVWENEHHSSSRRVEGL